MIALVAATAFAQDPPPPAPPPAPPPREFKASFTVGPLLGVTLPGADDGGLTQMANLFIESRQGKGVGMGLIGGFGRVDQALSWELGLGVRGYPVGDFHTGLVLGAEMLFLHRSGLTAGPPPKSGASFGPVLGFKWTAPIGFTLEFTGGASARFYGEGFDTAESGFGPLAHVQVGWSL